MDTALNIDGDFDVVNDSVSSVEGLKELKQKMYITLSVRKGAFIYDRELGSDVFETDLNSSNCVEEIEMKARNALSDFPNVEVIGVIVDENVITVSVEYNDEVLEIELVKQEG